MTILVIETTLIITYDGFGTENDCVDIVYISGTYFPWQHYGIISMKLAGRFSDLIHRMDIENVSGPVWQSRNCTCRWSIVIFRFLPSCSKVYSFEDSKKLFVLLGSIEFSGKQSNSRRVSLTDRRLWRADVARHCNRFPFLDRWTTWKAAKWLPSTCTSHASTK